MQHELQLSTDCQRDMTSSQMQHVVKLCGIRSRRQLTKFGKAHHHAPLIRLRRMPLYKFVLIDWLIIIIVILDNTVCHCGCILSICWLIATRFGYDVSQYCNDTKFQIRLIQSLRGWMGMGTGTKVRPPAGLYVWLWLGSPSDLTNNDISDDLEWHLSDLFHEMAISRKGCKTES